MTDVQDVHAQLRAINQSAAFNRWCGLEVKSASAGQVELVMPWRAEFGQYSGFLHAGLIAALIDTACGFAAVTVAGPGVLAAHFSVNCLRPAQGEHFIARARVVRAGKTQVFTACELFAVVCARRKAGRHRRNAAERSAITHGSIAARPSFARGGKRRISDWGRHVREQPPRQRSRSSTSSDSSHIFALNHPSLPGSSTVTLVRPSSSMWAHSMVWSSGCRRSL